MKLKEFNWSDATSLQWFQEALLEQGHNLARQRMWEEELFEQAKKLQNRGVSEQNRKQKDRNLETNDRRFDWKR